MYMHNDTITLSEVSSRLINGKYFMDTFVQNAAVFKARDE